LLALLLSAACKKERETSSTQGPSPIQQKEVEQSGRVEPAIVACNLITSEEVGAIQKATITDAKSSAGPSGNLVMSQCYYSAKEANMSVSLALIQPRPRSTPGTEVRDYWDKTMHVPSEPPAGEAQRDKPDQKNERGEEEEKKVPPNKIDGVGDEACWSGNRFGGALYVLKRNVILRISIGGPDDQEKKLEKSKTLAQKALGRLP